jgi:dephospho-CoA kinase
MIKIGITGGIGSGKSIVSTLLGICDIIVYNADNEAKRLTDSSPLIHKKLVDLFGEEIYADGRVNRKLLASHIFSDESSMNKVNNIIHPVVREDFKSWINIQDGPYCALESAILFEADFQKDVDIVLMVYAPVELRLSRVIQRDGLSEAEVLKRMNRQIPDSLKRQEADFTVINDNHNPLIPQIEDFIKYLNQ